MTAQAQPDAQIKSVARNRKARHDYEIVETYEAGISLLGSEVKSIRLGKINLSDSYATIENEGLVLKNLHISPYEQASADAHEPLRPRQLLLHKRELRKIARALQEKGLTVVPLHIYFKNSLVKVELGIGRGRRKHDKRESIARKESEREIQRATKRGS